MHGIVGRAWCYDRWYVRIHLPLMILHAIISTIATLYILSVRATVRLVNGILETCTGMS